MVLPRRRDGIYLHVRNIRIRCAFAAEQGEAVEVGFLAFSLDVDAVVGIVVFHIACQVALKTISVHITAKPNIEHATVNSYGIGFCHRANFNPGMVLSRAYVRSRCSLLSMSML